MAVPVQLIINAALTVASIIISIALRKKQSNTREIIARLDKEGVPRASDGDPIPMVLGQSWVRSLNTILYFNMYNQYTEILQVTIDLAVCAGTDVSLLELDIDGEIRSLGGTVPLHTHPNDPWPLEYGSVAAGEEGGSTLISSTDIGYRDDGHSYDSRAYLYWFNGSLTQPSAYDYTHIDAVDQLPVDLPSYRGVAHLYMAGVRINDYNGTLPPMAMLVESYPNPEAVATDTLIMEDRSMNAALALLAVLEDVENGLGMDSTNLDITSFLNAATTLADEQNGVSLTLAGSTGASSVVQEILDQIDGLLFQDMSQGGLVSLKLLRDDYGSEDVPHFNESNVQSIDSWTKATWDTCINTLHVEYFDPTKKGSASCATVKDDVLAEEQGHVRGTHITYPGLVDKILARKIARKDLGAAATPHTQITLTVNRTGYELKPGDVFTLSWDKYGVDHMSFRVAKTSDGSAIDNAIQIDAVEDRFAENSGYADNPGTGWTADAIYPDEITTFEIVEAPWWLATSRRVSSMIPSLSAPLGPFRAEYGALNVWYNEAGDTTVYERSNPLWSRYMFLAADTGNMNGMQALGHEAEDFNPAYEQYPEIRKGPMTPSGTCITAITPTSGFTHGLISSIVVNGITPVTQEFQSQSMAQIRGMGKGLLYCNGEFAAFMTAAYISDDGTSSNYTFTNVFRGLFGSPFATWTNKRVYFIEKHQYWLGEDTHFETLGTMPGDSSFITDINNYPPETYAKFRSYRGSYTNNLTDLTAQTVPEGVYTAFAPLAPTYVTVDNSRTPGTVSGDILISWRPRSTRTSGVINLFNDPGDATLDDEIYYNILIQDLNAPGQVSEWATLRTGITNRSIVIDTTEIVTGNSDYKVYVVAVWVQGADVDNIGAQPWGYPGTAITNSTWGHGFSVQTSKNNHYVEMTVSNP